MKILFYDLETSPNVTWTWGLFNQNIGISQVIDSSRVICISARWLDSPECMYFSEHDMPHAEMIRKAHELFQQADYIAGFNNRRFDDLHIAREFAVAGLAAVNPKSIDLYRVTKRRFKFTSHKLEWVAREFGLTGKEQHRQFPGFELWKECLAGNPDAWHEMEIYSRQDTNLLVELWEKLKPWVPGSMYPNYVLVEGIVDPVCVSCGSGNYRKNGFHYSSAGKFQKWECKDCGRQFRSVNRVATAEFRAVA